MIRRFEIAEKLINGEVQTQYNPSKGVAEIVTWNVIPANIPSFVPGTNYVIFKAAEATMIPSIWKGFMGVANNGLNAITNKINSMFGQASAVVPEADNYAPFKPVDVHTGVKVVMPKNEALKISASPKCYKNGLVLVSNDIIHSTTTPHEIVFSFYNFLNTDITLQCGDEIAVGTFIKVEGAAVITDTTQPKIGSVSAGTGVGVGTSVGTAIPKPITTPGISLNKQ